MSALRFARSEVANLSAAKQGAGVPGSEGQTRPFTRTESDGTQNRKEIAASAKASPYGITLLPALLFTSCTCPERLSIQTRISNPSARSGSSAAIATCVRPTPDTGTIGFGARDTSSTSLTASLPSSTPIFVGVSPIILAASFGSSPSCAMSFGAAPVSNIAWSICKYRSFVAGSVLSWSDRSACTLASNFSCPNVFWPSLIATWSAPVKVFHWEIHAFLLALRGVIHAGGRGGRGLRRHHRDGLRVGVRC